jgi:FG-GAP-like repeat
VTGPCAATCLLALASLPAAAASQVQAPVLKWQHGGCYSSWCETGWYSSPAVADLDGDGAVEVIASAYSIVVLDGATGALEWRVASGHDRSEPGADNEGRTWPGIVVADVDDDGELEIASAHGGGWLSLYDRQGFFEPGWPQRPTTSELRGLAVADLDLDGDLEVVASAALSSGTNTWVFEHDGGVRPGWPQLAGGTPGYAWGVFNDNVAIGDLDGSGAPEVVVPSDVHYICAYRADGTPVPGHPMYGGRVWGEVGVWESLVTELQGWGTCDTADGRDQRNRTNFAHGPASLADLDGDGQLEIVAAGNTYDCAMNPYQSLYSGLFVFGGDRSRFVASGFDWQTVPLDTGAPLSEDFNVIENAHPNPVPADLDGDGVPEILFPSYDGRLHAFWLDKTEHGAWPFSVYHPADGFYRFASEPVVADLDGDGSAEVLFTSWTAKASQANGRLHVLDGLGNPLYEVTLPAALGTTDWNGALAAPTLANLDGDPDLEIVINTAFSGLVAYDLPGTAAAKVLWGTGRGSYARAGRANDPDAIFADGFESGDVSRWTSAVP